MAMAAKKERGRFSLRFNISDPVQRAAVELLELQPPHSKSQYIANALTYYNAHFADAPQPIKVPTIDRTVIETIVREILRQETRQARTPVTDPDDCPVIESASALPETATEQDNVLEAADGIEVDDMTRALISSTMAAFRRKG